MKSIHVIALILTVSFAAFTTAAADDKDDAKTVQGTWLPVKADLGGQAMPDAVLKTIRLELNDGKYTAYVGEEPDKGTYTLDAATTPKGMTITGTEGPNHGKTFPAIYEIGHDDTGDTLRICYDLSGAKRPTEFKSVAGTKLYLVTYRRKPQ
jgi:uncharacterized protein (TIGR03067 family)